MRSPRTASIWRGVALGAVWTAAFVAIGSAVEAAGGPVSPASRLFEWLTRVLPGAVITFAIDHMVALVRALGTASTAAASKTIEKAMAAGFAVALGALIGGFIAVVTWRGAHRMREALVREARERRRARPAVIGVVTGACCAVVYLLVVMPEHAPLAIAIVSVGFVVWGLVLGTSIGTTLVHETVGERRHALILLGALGALTAVVAAGLARVLRRPPPPVPSAPPEATGRIKPVPGTRKELTPTEAFYRIDINLEPPHLDAASWHLETGGLFARPRQLTLAELHTRPAVTQTITLECISNPVGGDLIGTAQWTGFPFAPLLDELGISPDARALVFEAADGYHESAMLDELRDPRALLVHAMNGAPLTAEHGFPLRLYIPDRHGMKLPKWIRRIEAVATPRPGYWVERGWSRTAIPHTTSVIDTTRTSGTQLAIGGIAYAGARGISRVEVQLDDGPWQPAQLRTPALSPLTWVQWRLDTQAASGTHTIRVRAYDGRGTPQETAVAPPHPDGATGIDEKKVTV
jgi:DMSO/TMAO reductase YedYZ molybdopterin-dependent catalytic subunit